MKNEFFLIIVLIMFGNILAFAKTPQEVADAFMQSLSEGNYRAAVADFDNAMNNAIPVDKLEMAWNQIISTNGKLQKIEDKSKSNYQIYTIIIKHLVFEKSELNAIVSIDSSNKIAGLSFVPAEAPAAKYVDADYVDKSKFSEIPIKLTDTIITGKLTLPNNAASQKVPLIILVHGSGPNDEDETSAVNKPFRDIAFGLSSRGIAVFRYNKRTLVDKNISASLMTINEETVNDVVDAANIFQRQYSDKFDKIYILGHSLGGYALARIAKRVPQASGFICLAGNSRPLEELISEQVEYLNSLKIKEITDAETIEQINQITQQTRKSCMRIKQRNYDINTPADSLPLSISAIYWNDLKDYNPAKELQGETRPMLFIQGERDYQVTTVDFDIWKKNLTKPSNKFVLIPNLNHLFQSGTGKSTPNEYFEKKNVDSHLIDVIHSWVLPEK